MANLKPMYPGIPFSPIVMLTKAINKTDTVIHVTSTDVFPAGPGYATIGTDEEAETIFYKEKRPLNILFNLLNNK